MRAAAEQAARRLHGGQVGLELDHVWRKRFSVVHRYSISTPTGTRQLYVKAPIERDDRTGPKWPRVIPTHHSGSPAKQQAAALADLAAAIDECDLPLLGGVRILDSPDDDLVIMTAARGRPLRELALAHVRWHRTAERRDLDDVMNRVGLLLRLFHDKVLRPDSPVALADRAELVDGVDRLIGHLTDVSRSSAIDTLRDRIVGQIESHLPQQLGVATRFGDFGLTNLLVDDDGAVTAIDTLGALRAPPLHDATYFVTAIVAIRPQLSTRNLAIPASTIEGWQQAFWLGYLENRPFPAGAVATWSAVRLLERWAAKSNRSRPMAARLLGDLVVDSGMERLVSAMVETAERAEPAPETVNRLVVS
ncbi:MAG: hypothetical protein OES24_18200 [Acidimicrobiia bacterium]|nr:hypothetical protein [Acidimicrobiia bacterium]